MENHDEPRAAATFARPMHEAAAIITYLSPGLRFFHQGQFEGRRKRISPHLVRAPLEATDGALQRFYEGLRAVLQHPVFRDGEWRLLECAPAWEDNWTGDCFVAWVWKGAAGDRRLVAVNYAANQSQCYVRVPLQDLGERSVRFEDLMGSVGTSVSIVREAISTHTVCTWTCPHGATTCSTSPRSTKRISVEACRLSCRAIACQRYRFRKGAIGTTVTRSQRETSGSAGGSSSPRRSTWGLDWLTGKVRQYWQPSSRLRPVVS